MFLKIERDLREIIKNLDPVNTYIVGGYVRDKIIGRDAKDIDIVSALSIESISKKLKAKPYIVNDRFSTARFHFQNINIDYNKIENLDSDLKRRDFTINSIACDLTGKIIDPLKGSNDIINKVIRTSSTDALKDDPIRILRAFRLKRQLGFSFSKNLNSLIKDSSKLLAESPKERVYAEIKEILSQIGGGGSLRELHKAGALTVIFPALQPTLKFMHVKYKSRYLIGHLLNTTEAVDLLLMNRLPRDFREYADSNLFSLYLSALFHDIFKPECFTIEGKKQRFFNHDILASKRISKILKESLKVSNEEAERISLLIKLHMRPHYLLNQGATDKGIYRLFREAGADVSGLMILCMADILASEGRIERGYIKLYKRMQKIEEKINKKQVRLLNGSEIMAAFGIKPGRLVGEMLESGNSWAVENNVSDKGKIISYLKEEFFP
ncbi:MAG: CCA tRNA nucleotidyltransferase [bacterium]